MSAVTIINTLADQHELVAVPMDVIEHRDQIVDQAIEASRSITTVEQHQAADGIHKALQRFLSSIELHRKALKAPILDIGRQLDEAAKEATQPVLEAKRLIEQAIFAYEQAENARREQERLRLEAEAREAQRIEDERAEAVRQAKAAEISQPDPDAMPDEAPVQASVIDDLPVRVAVAVAPAPLKSSVRQTVSYELVIEDLAKVPRDINGVALFTLDEKTALKLLSTGMAIPGLSRREIKGLGSKAVRA